jgi:hypothetical protein
MTEKNTILLNLNRFGPIFSESEKNWLLTKPKKKDIQQHKKISIEMLEGILGKNFSKIKKDEIKRYCEITDKETHLSITPSQNYEALTNRIIQPLLLAKKYFSLGEYLSCITLAGLSSEMMSHVIWGMSTFSMGGNAMDEDEQKVIFGKIDQERRIKILYLTKSIDEDSRKMLEEIRKIRNKYIHSWDISTRQDKGNAKKAIRFALILFKNISGINLTLDKDGKQQLQVNPRFLNFIKSKIKE